MFDLLLLFIITVPAFLSLLNSEYFSMHDDQHIVRLYLLDQGIRQGYLYPRWVDGLGFGFGYPLYNFYPPLIYYIGEFFHILGFSLIWSVKLVFISGFILGAIGIYLLVKKYTNRLSALVSAALYTYFFYHAVLIYARGALAEFFALAILPFVFLSMDNLVDKTNWRNCILFGVSLALLILTQPLIALPSMIFIGFYFIFYLLKTKFKHKFIYLFAGSLILGLSLSAFYWLPSLSERKYTLTDKILTGELASYKLHYIYPGQFIYSPWGFGGSAEGLADGVTFQLGKVHIGLTIGAILLAVVTYFLERFRHSVSRVPYGTRSSRIVVQNSDPDLVGMTLPYFFFCVFLLIFSLFMTTGYSSFIWDRVGYLWYLQFPWRFLTFTTILISILGGCCIFFIFRLLNQYIEPRGFNVLIQGFIYNILVIFLVAGTIITYQKYFKPQRVLMVTDKELTAREEISWRISRTSYEFVPKGIKTKKSELDTTELAIEKKDLPQDPYKVILGDADIETVKNNFQNKEFSVNAKTQLIFRLNTYNFPGWTTYLNSQKTSINDRNDYKLITLNIPQGQHELKFVFKNTPVRNLANFLTLTAVGVLVMLNIFQHLNLRKNRS